MTLRIVSDKEANLGYYLSTAYCYNSDCPARTEKQPWPHSDGIAKDRKTVCKHCGKEMTWTFPTEAFA